MFFMTVASEMTVASYTLLEGGSYRLELAMAACYLESVVVSTGARSCPEASSTRSTKNTFTARVIVGLLMYEP